MIGAIHIGTLLINLACALVLSGVGYWVINWYCTSGRRERVRRVVIDPEFVIRLPNEGKRGMWWLGIYDRQGRRIFQTAPPGHASWREALDAAQALARGPIQLNPETDEVDES